jgi:DNA mismatch repair ATPase MutS
MHQDRDFDLEQPPPWNERELTQDLGLAALFDAMSQGDGFLRAVARTAVLNSLIDVEAIRYRQDILRDSLAQPAVVRELYGIAEDAVRVERTVWGGFVPEPTSILHRCVDVLELLSHRLARLRQVAEDHNQQFSSAGFTALFQMLIRELDEAYLAEVDNHLRQMKFRRGVLMSARLGLGNRGTDYVLRTPKNPDTRVLRRFASRKQPGLIYRLTEGDDSGAVALEQMRNRGLNQVANTVAQSVEHVLGFFQILQAELGFYVGCLNLHDVLAGKGGHVCFPTPVAARDRALSCRGLQDVSLVLTSVHTVVGADVEADGKTLTVITGANQGGKSTLLRAVGLAQLMMQSGMFTAAEMFRGSSCVGLFTHFPRQEDATMTRGRLDEELNRLSGVVDHLTGLSMLLSNESFASTNEQEGSHLAREIVRALLESGVRVLLVTHLYDLAHTWYREQTNTMLFLRAERRPDGERTFRLVPAEPLATSYGPDLYERIMADVVREPSRPVEVFPSG